MSVTVTVNEEFIEIDLTGIDAVLALRRHLRVSRANVAHVDVRSVREAKENLGLRIGGGYFPGRLATGHFLSRRGLKGRQFWSVYRDTEVLVIDLVEGNLRRIVLQTPERSALALRIRAISPSTNKSASK